MVVVDAGLSDERMLGLQFHDAIEKLASSVVPGESVSAYTIRLSANSEQHQLECARSKKHPPLQRAVPNCRYILNCQTDVRLE